MPSDSPKLTLAANAIHGRGGQGINLSQMIAGLSDSFTLRVFSHSRVPNVHSTITRRSRLGRLIGGTPVFRRFRDFHTYAEDVAFDRQVASKLESGAIFQGVTGQCLSSIMAAKNLGSKTVLDSITVHIDEFASIGRRECIRFGIRFPVGRRMQQRMRREYAHADLIRVMSDYAQSTFIERGFGEERVVVAEPHYDMSDFSGVNSGQSPFRVCYLGALEPWKGFQHIVEAFAKLEVDDAELRLWGGSGTSAVAEHIDRALRQAPRISQGTVDVRDVGFGAVFEGASVLVHPSLTDGWGQVVPEAMACGIPVIVTSSTGASGIVRDGENGFLVKPGDSDAILDRLRVLASDREKIKSMGQAARETISALTIVRNRDRYVPRLTNLLR